MTRPNVMLFGAAVAYPVGSFILLRLTSGPVGIPHPGHLVVFSFILPAVCVGVAIWAKLAGARLSWVGVGAFAIWLSFVGGLHYWFITGLWDSI
jgi:hypothetical protein